MLSLRLSGLLLLRLAARTFVSLLLNEPPRNTLFSACPHATADGVLIFTLLPLCALALFPSSFFVPLLSRRPSCASSRR